MSLVITLPTFGQILTNGVYVQNDRTIEVDKHLHSFLPTQKAEILYFSNDLIIKLEKDSDFSVNSFYQEILTFTNYHKVKFGTHSLSATLSDGSAIFSYSGANDESTSVISTPLNDIELNNGTFYSVVSSNKVIVVVLDGSLKTESGKKQLVVTNGYALIVRPNDLGIVDYKINTATLGRLQNMMEDKVSISAEKVNVSTINKLKSDITDVLDLKKSVVFINGDGKLIGININ